MKDLGKCIATFGVAAVSVLFMCFGYPGFGLIIVIAGTLFIWGEEVIS